MARRSRSTGVGRGNGPGSAKTQFRAGMPSGNPHGRPKKVKAAVPRSLSKAIKLELSRMIQVEEGGEKDVMPFFQAMVKALGADFKRATINEKIRILNWMAANAPEMRDEGEHQPSEDAVHKMVEALAEQARQMDPNYKPVWQ